MSIKAGNLPTSTIDNTDYLLITEGEAPKRVAYSDIKNDIIGTETLTTTAQTIKGAIIEIDADLSGKVNKSSIVNNLLATVEGSVLDATQGKVIQDKINLIGKKHTYYINEKTVIAGSTDTPIGTSETLPAGTYMYFAKASYASGIIMKLKDSISGSYFTKSKVGQASGVITLSASATITMHIETTSDYIVYNDATFYGMQIIRLY